MKTITKTVNLYSYEELTQDAKEKAHQDWVENNTHPFLSLRMREEAEKIIAKNGITNENGDLKVFYSLSYSQGDGAMFQGTFEWKQNTIAIKQSGHYNHYNSKTIEFSDTEDENLSKEFDKLYVSMCQELEQFGYDTLEEDDNEESFIEECALNEWTFLEDGTMENEIVITN